MIKKNPKVKESVIATPTVKPYFPTEVVAQAIKETQTAKIPPVALPKPTYEGLSPDSVRRVTESSYGHVKSLYHN